MRFFRHGVLISVVIGAFWAVTSSITLAVLLSFISGENIRPSLLGCLVVGAMVGVFVAGQKSLVRVIVFSVALAVFGIFTPFSYMLLNFEVSNFQRIFVATMYGLSLVLPLHFILKEVVLNHLSRHVFETAIIRFLYGFGYVFFTAIVLIPFYVMVMTSLKSQQALLQNPLDFRVDFMQGKALFKSYYELFSEFNFGNYLLISFFVSVCTVLITLMFSIPGAYAVARLRFRGRSLFSSSILLIYMVPIIVLALPIYIAFSLTGLRNTLFGIIMIYPVTTIPVALYMLQGYFRGLPHEVEEAGLMDGLSRMQVIRKIVLPLSLPALVSVSLYVFMIAWNEFLLAFMLLDDPSKFTLTRGVSMLNSSELPREHLMAGSVIATIPILILFLSLERFMTKGLTAGSVKG